MTRKSIADLAYDILEENHHPMHYRRITEKILKIKNIKAEKPHHVVNALMGADNRFVKYQRGIWGLIKWKYREANLSYNLTSYCLLNGTIFLTSYLKPYFSWHFDDRTIEILFVDSEGELITAELNYRKKTISGFKEWFKKKDLKVNDSILIGLVDKTKKIYFILAEKEISKDTEKKDLSDFIYQILDKENKPLSFFQIYSEITKREDDDAGLLKDYIENILEEDSRFLLTDSNQWSLVDWLDEEDKIYHNLYFAKKPEEFIHSLSVCFSYFGYRIEQVRDNPQKMFVAHADLATKSYSLIISGLHKNYNLNDIHSVDWDEMKKEKERVRADSIIIFTERLLLSELISRAGEEGVMLYELSALDYIIEQHNLIPFSLLDLRIAFNPLNNPQKNLVKLKQKRDYQWDNWLLIKIIVNTLQTAKIRNTPMDMNYLIKEISNSEKWSKGIGIEQYKIKKIISILSQEPFGLIESSESGIITLTYPDQLIQEKINNVWQFIMHEETRQDNL